MADAHINGARIWYEVHGEGEDYLLQIGGAGFAHENFGFVTDKMTPHFKVIEFDLRGYGLSDRPEQEYSMEIWADDIKGLFDAIGVQRAHVHGTSMGGMVALAFAGRYPELVDGLVLDCASAKSDFMARAHWEVWKQLALAYGMGGEPLALEIATKCLSRAFLDTPAGPETVKVIQGVLERNCAVPVFAGACDAMATMDLRPAAARVTAPTLVMTGSEDCLTPIDAGPDGAGARWLAENIAGAELYVIEGSGHTNLMEQPELSAKVVIEFFETVAREAGHRLMHVALCDVGPRDGLQNDALVLEPAVRAELCDRLAATGLPRIECGSFVNPKVVPQMAGAEEVFAALHRVDGVVYAALALNGRGVERAVAAGIDEVHLAYPLSDTFCARNQNTTLAEAAAAHEAMIAAAHAAGVRASVTLGASFGCPFEGPVPEARVIEHVERMARSGADEIMLADTIGVGVPKQVRSLVPAALRAAAGIPIGLHLHNTRNTGYANADAGIESGATIFDASIGGLGGCPFAPRATGNIATEDLVYLLDGLGVETGVDLDALITVSEWLAGVLGRDLPGQLYKAGPFVPAG